MPEFQHGVRQMNHAHNRRAFVARAAALAAAGSGAGLTSEAMAKSMAQESDQPDFSDEATPMNSSVREKVNEATLEEAEKLAGISFTQTERKQMLRTIDEQRSMIQRRIAMGPLPNQLPPAELFRAELPGVALDPATTTGDPWEHLPDPGPCPLESIELAYAPVWKLGQWLKRRELSSVQLTELSLQRLREADPLLNCVVSLTEDRAMKQARQADEQLRAGTWRGPLHGIPWGAKDLIDARDTRTTWGASPYRERVATEDAHVVRALDEAGAVLVAKLAVGALAYGDIWFGGTCKNPFDTNQGSSGSSAGSASATAAGLVPFTLGTETYGSIVSPCDRCGATGLRPTFGRVARNGVMALCWSMDKIGPITRSVLDTALVLKAINGADPADPCSVSEPFHFDSRESARGLRVAFDPSWFDGDDRVLETLRRAKVELVPTEMPKIDTSPLLIPLFAESSACFEELTRSGADDALSWQEDRAWPNTFRQSWFIPAVELVQASRVRRQVMETMESFMNDRFDAIVCPPFTELLLITNATGHPSVVLRRGFTAEGRPESVTLIGRLFDEGTLCRLGRALEDGLDAEARRPEQFS
ncbi:MAG: hypothetical protein CBC35_06525 [Planctomycetes bacterium TMED75]|nr:amidase [Planctomycetaceae bacterium]OUU92860.1 MAG: hypothetical protein CBC35_06525 [Planctomycetes bacterium TMED75]